MEDRKKVWDSVQNLLGSQRLAVLATDRGGNPYTSLVGYVVSEDLREILFATTRATQKYRNLEGNPQVSLLVDNRRNTEADFHEACAATVLGSVVELKGAERGKAQTQYLAKHPALEEFVRSPSCAILRVQVDLYHFVNRFQNVVTLKVRP